MHKTARAITVVTRRSCPILAARSLSWRHPIECVAILIHAISGPVRRAGMDSRVAVIAILVIARAIAVAIATRGRNR
ncbi:MAG TPA: hypothetical protein VFG83_09655 [Kofleriaceae bacterium]|nr:hypothetical protein [Kofleriaceae bacterium]